MIRNINVSDHNAVVCSAFQWRAIRRYGTLIAAAGFLAGCAGNVTMQNPQTGATTICPGSHREFDPWSQTMACVADYEAQGWTRANPE
jgi:hypothetical protein